MARQIASAAALRRTMLQQLTTGRALVALAEMTERALIAGDPARLETITPQQRALLEQQAAHEAARQQATAELSARCGMTGAPTLTGLLPALSPVDAQALAGLRARILETSRRADSLNRSNARLLENALEFVKFNLQALTSAALKPARYGVNLAQLAAPSFYIDSKA